MAQGSTSPDSLDQWRRLLDRCWNDDCDIDPLILPDPPAAQLGRWRQARCLEQELLPLF